MQLLADALTDERLAALYRSLLRAEARHHATYVTLAARRPGRDAVDARLAELAQHEAAVLVASRAALHACQRRPTLAPA